MDATRGRVFVDQSDRRTEDILSAMDHFGGGAKTDRSNSSSNNAVKTHPLLTSPSPTEPLGLPLLSSSAATHQPQTVKVTQNNPMNHPLHHPPPNAWNSPKHQSRLSNLLGSSSSSFASQAPAAGSSSKVHPAAAERKTSSNSSSSSSVSAAAARGSLNTPSSSTHEALHEAEYFNAKLGTSFCDEFDRLFASPRPWTALRDHAINSRLRNCRFRSLCWKVFLLSLSEDVKKWEGETNACRLRYKNLKRKYSLNPRTADEAEQLDLNLNNPLSQAEDSPWSQYFKDKELKQTIWQDVVRTFPEIEFFQTNLVQQLMQDILFVYAREHPSTEYRQGMHELLAPLIFVIHCDQQTCAHACEVEDSVPPLIKTLLEEKSLEPDAYDMFCRMMDIMEPLYQYGEQTPVVKDSSSAPSSSMTGSTELPARTVVPTEPFKNKEEPDPRLTCTSAINTKLRYICESILIKHDHELYTHLERLDIAPQIYGLRWVRLLFGREFPLQDLLILWDAIFADEACFQLVDFLFVAMLQFLRDFLLASEYTSCMKVLMKFPAVGDAAWFIKKAYNLRDPFSHPRPSNFSYSNILAKRAKMAKQLAGSANNGGVGGNSQDGNNDFANSRPTSNSSAILTMVAGKQTAKSNVSHHHSSSSSSSTLPRSNSKSSPSEENNTNGAASSSSSSVSSALSDGFSRLMNPAGSEVILGTTTKDGGGTTTTLFSAAAQSKDALRRQRAISEGVTSTTTGKRSAGLAQRLHVRVSTAEEALPGGDEETSTGEVGTPTVSSHFENSDLEFLKRELKASRNRANDLETTIGDVGALIQSSIMKISLLSDKIKTVESTKPEISKGELTKEALQVQRLLKESLKICLAVDSTRVVEGLEDESKVEEEEEGKDGVSLKTNDLIPIGEEIEESAANCLDDAAREALQSALMEEAVEAIEPTQPVATPHSAHAATTTTPKSVGLTVDEVLGEPSVSPSSDSSDYSMVDANDEYIVDFVEGCEKKL